MFSNLSNRRLRPTPQDVGILALEVYFPARCVAESALETFDGVSSGKYTIGLGQQYMAFTDDREDMNTFALTALSQLLSKYNIDPKSIGRLEVGTESLVDKSKSTKTVLMDLFARHGNYDIEGIDSKNACYGSTAAVFNSINWIESSSWDGRNAIVVCGDIAVYAKGGSARAVGGAGAVAILIGPNAPLVFEPIHGSYMANFYDFYKPSMGSEYPTVDGPLTIETYIKALDRSYQSYKRKLRALLGDEESKKVDITSFDYSLLHCPYCKLVSKGFARMAFNDFLDNPQSTLFSSLTSDEIAQIWKESPAGVDRSLSFASKPIEKTFINFTHSKLQNKSKHTSTNLFDERVLPGLLAAKRLGNAYTGSLYLSLASLLSNVDSKDLQGKRLALFAFGGGCAASFFSVVVRGDTSNIARHLNLKERLESVRVVSCEEYDGAMELREKNHDHANLHPEGSLDNIAKGAYYVKHIDELFRRQYAVSD